MKRQRNKVCRGFTLVEMVLTIGLLGVAIGVSTTLLQGFQNRSDLDDTAQALVSLFRRAQLLSLSQAGDATWGVRLTGENATLFQGDTWESRNASLDEEHIFPARMSLSGLSEVTFSKVYGSPSSIGTTTITADDGSERYVFIGDIGAVSSGTVVPPELLFPEMDVYFGSAEIASGSIQDEGTILIGDPQSRAYTIQNTGQGTLDLTGSPLVQISSLTNITSASVTLVPLSTVGSGSETSFELQYQVTASGPFSFAVTLPNTDANEEPYTWIVSGAGTFIPLPPEIEVVSDVALPDGGIHAVGQQQRNVAKTVTYLIQNTGGSDVNLTGNPTVTLSAVQRVDTLAVTLQPSTTINPDGSTTLVISYIPRRTGPFSFTVSIPNNDPDEAPYNWTVAGTSAGSGGGPVGPPPEPGGALPEIDIVSNVSVADGGTHTVGQQQRNVSRTITYLINNLGDSDLNLLGNPAVSLTANQRVSALTATLQPSTTINPDGSTTLVISYIPRRTGPFSFTVSIPNNDPDEAPYNWTVVGTSAGSGGGDTGP